MRPMVALLAIALGSAMMFGQEAGKAVPGQGKEMSGYLCDSKCVKQEAGKPTCDPNCTEESNQVVFVSDQGRVVPVDNPEVAKGKKGKCKIHGEMMKDQGKLHVYDVVFANAG